MTSWSCRSIISGATSCCRARWPRGGSSARPSPTSGCGWPSATRRTMPRGEKSGATRTTRACCLVSEMLEEAGLDREKARQLRRQLLEGMILLCRWQLERMEPRGAPPLAKGRAQGRRPIIRIASQHGDRLDRMPASEAPRPPSHRSDRPFRRRNRLDVAARRPRRRSRRRPRRARPARTRTSSSGSSSPPREGA